jgi:hypothetical protein
MQQGYVVIETGWGLPPPAGKLFTITMPVARNPDGSAIMGPANEECSSGPCRIMHDFVGLGFNEAEGAKAFDGVLNWKGGGSGLFMNYRFGQPGRTHRQHIARWTPEYQFPFANQVVSDRVTGKTDSRLARCEASKACSKIFEANSSNEYWAKTSSMLLTDSEGRDLPPIDNVRNYLLSSFPHAPGNGRGICSQPRNPLGAKCGAARPLDRSPTATTSPACGCPTSRCRWRPTPAGRCAPTGSTAATPREEARLRQDQGRAARQWRPAPLARGAL